MSDLRVGEAQCAKCGHRFAFVMGGGCPWCAGITPQADAQAHLGPSGLAPEGQKALIDAWDTLRDQIDDVVCWMMKDERLNPGGLYAPVGGERAMVELAAEFDKTLRASVEACPSRSASPPSSPEGIDGSRASMAARMRTAYVAASDAGRPQDAWDAASLAALAWVREQEDQAEREAFATAQAQARTPSAAGAASAPEGIDPEKQKRASEVLVALGVSTPAIEGIDGGTITVEDYWRERARADANEKERDDLRNDANVIEVRRAQARSIMWHELAQKAETERDAAIVRAETTERRTAEARAVLKLYQDAVDRVFQTCAENPEPILPDFLGLGECKAEGIVRLAEAYRAIAIPTADVVEIHAETILRVVSWAESFGPGIEREYACREVRAFVAKASA